jgi:hypothetical protein
MREDLALALLLETVALLVHVKHLKLFKLFLPYPVRLRDNTNFMKPSAQPQSRASPLGTIHPFLYHWGAACAQHHFKNVDDNVDVISTLSSTSSTPVVSRVPALC